MSAVKFNHRYKCKYIFTSYYNIEGPGDVINTNIRTGRLTPFNQLISIMPMKKFSTPTLKSTIADHQTIQSEIAGPSQKTLRFIRDFARSCRSMPLQRDANLSAFILN